MLSKPAILGGVLLHVLAQPSLHCARVGALSSSQNLLTLSVSGRSHCGGGLILRSLAEPAQHFAHVRSLSFAARCSSRHHSRNPLVTLRVSKRSRRGLALIPSRRSCQGDVRRACTRILTRGVSQRSCQGISHRDIVRTSLTEILTRASSLFESLNRGLII